MAGFGLAQSRSHTIYNSLPKPFAYSRLAGSVIMGSDILRHLHQADFPAGAVAGVGTCQGYGRDRSR